MQHPLMNFSLTPFGFVFPLYKQRLNYVPTTSTGINGERILAGLWEEWNRAKSASPLPAKVILHEILPSQATANKLDQGEFSFQDLPYLSRDILVLSSALQWLATNCGTCFLETDISEMQGYHPEREFLIKFKKEQARRDMVVLWTHVCNKLCHSEQPLHPFSDPHHYKFDSVTTRDRAIVDGLMRWLGRPQGREFTEEFLSLRKKKSRKKWEEAYSLMKAA